MKVGEQASLKLCNLISRGVPMSEARKQLGIPDPVTEEVAPTDETPVVTEETVEQPTEEVTEEVAPEEEAPKKGKKRR